MKKMLRNESHTSGEHPEIQGETLYSQRDTEFSLFASRDM